MSKTSKATRPVLTAIAEAHGLTVESKPNGAGIITGPMEALEAAWEEMWRKARISPRFVLSSTEMDAVAPRIEVHPQVWARK